jgi:nickel-dependent lactate racemase
MSESFRYGQCASCRLPPGDVTLLAADDSARPPTADPAQEMRRALAKPIDFPPLAAAIAPGDHVAVVAADGLPRAAELVAGALWELLDAGVEPAAITVAASARTAPTLEPLLAGDVDRQLARRLDGLQVSVHNPEDATQHAMIGVTAAHRPLRVQRSIADADLVLPLTAASVAATDRPSSQLAGFFPEFSDRETAERLHLAASAASDESALKQRKKSVAEIDEAVWLLGVSLAAAIVPAAHGEVAEVVGGSPAGIAARAAETLRTIWRRPAPAKGDLAIATLVGGAVEQSWENLRRALATAASVASPGAAIVLCTELAERPGKAVGRLRGAVDFAAAAREARRDRSVDAPVAVELAAALDRGPVYLRSRLPRELVESLGMTPLDGDEQLLHLASTRRRCVVIEEAQRLAVVEDDSF